MARHCAYPDNAPPSGKRSAEGGAGAGARLALPVGNYGETFLSSKVQA